MATEWQYLSGDLSPILSRCLAHYETDDQPSIIPLDAKVTLADDTVPNKLPVMP